MSCVLYFDDRLFSLCPVSQEVRCRKDRFGIDLDGYYAVLGGMVRVADEIEDSLLEPVIVDQQRYCMVDLFAQNISAVIHSRFQQGGYIIDEVGRRHFPPLGNGALYKAEGII